MAAVDEEPEDRHQHTIKLVQIDTCPKCGEDDEVEFDTGEYDMEMVDDDEALHKEVTCASCGQPYESSYTGWTHHTDAG